MDDLWTKKRGYINPITTMNKNIQAVSFNNNQRINLGGLSFLKTYRETENGSILTKSFGGFEKILESQIPSENIPETAFIFPYDWLSPKTIQKSRISGAVVTEEFITSETEFAPFIDYTNKEIYDLGPVTVDNGFHLKVYNLATGELKRTVVCTTIPRVAAGGGLDGITLYVDPRTQRIHISVQYWNAQYGGWIKWITAGIWMFSMTGELLAYNFGYGSRAGAQYGQVYSQPWLQY